MTKRNKLIWLNGIFIMSILASGIMATKLFGIFGFGIPAGVIVFPLTFLMTDIINEIWGKGEAINTVRIGFVANILFTLFIMISIKLPAFEYWTLQAEYQAILSAVPRITVAGLVSYAVSQSTDVWIYDRLKKAYRGEHLWIRNNVSTMTAQLVDSAIFIFIAFAGTMPVGSLVTTFFNQWIIKLILAALDTPFVYLGVKWVRNSEQE